MHVGIYALYMYMYIWLYVPQAPLKNFPSKISLTRKVPQAVTDPFVGGRAQ